MDPETRTNSSDAARELQAMNREQLQTELGKAIADLEDLEELRRGFLGQTGVHIGMRVLQSARRQFEHDETRLKERVALLKQLLRMEHVFDNYAERYDAWYDSAQGGALLAIELECLRPLLEQFPRPYLEVGVGTGQFAQALGVQYGLDPSPRALKKALDRGVEGVQGRGEEIPFQRQRFGAVLIAFTLCFVQNPQKVVAEVRRVQAPGGGLVLGLLLKGSPWADDYAHRGAQGHPLYRGAHFYSREEVDALLEQGGFRATRYRSTLFQQPRLKSYLEEPTVEGYVPGAGFVGIAAVRADQ